MNSRYNAAGWWIRELISADRKVGVCGLFRCQPALHDFETPKWIQMNQRTAGTIYVFIILCRKKTSTKTSALHIFQTKMEAKRKSKKIIHLKILKISVQPPIIRVAKVDCSGQFSTEILNHHIWILPTSLRCSSVEARIIWPSFTLFKQGPSRGFIRINHGNKNKFSTSFFTKLNDLL